MKKKIEVISGLRGWGALLVVLHHLFGRMVFPWDNMVAVGEIPIHPYTLITNGFTSVNLFFILSGFVLYLPYAAGARQLSSRADYAFYYKRRAKRLLPLYYASTAFFIIVYMAANGFFYDGWFSDLALMATGGFHFAPSLWFNKFNWVLWSLGVEIWASILFPIIALLILRLGIYPVLIGTLLFSLGVRIYGNGLESMEVNFYLNMARDSIFGRLDDFVVGMLACHLYLKGIKLSPAKAMGLFFFGLATILVGHTTWDYLGCNILPQSIKPFIYNIHQVGFFAIIIALLGADNSRIKYFFSNYFIVLLGMMSYSIYIWHGHLIALVVGGQFDFVHLWTYFWAVLLVAALSYRFIEFYYEPDAGKLFLPSRIIEK